MQQIPTNKTVICIALHINKWKMLPRRTPLGELGASPDRLAKFGAWERRKGKGEEVIEEEGRERRRGEGKDWTPKQNPGYGPDNRFRDG